MEYIDLTDCEWQEWQDIRLSHWPTKVQHSDLWSSANARFDALAHWYMCMNRTRLCLKHCARERGPHLRFVEISSAQMGRPAKPLVMWRTRLAMLYWSNVSEFNGILLKVAFS